jgi:hypothetical protein
MTLKTGMLAYFDSFTGLIPCKVVSITGKSGISASSQTVTLQTTAKRSVYDSGETIVTSGLRAVPRDAVRHSRFSGARIRPYAVEVDA